VIDRVTGQPLDVTTMRRRPSAGEVVSQP